MRTSEVLLRAEMSGNTLTGHAAVYNQTTRRPTREGYFERIAAGAFDEVVDSDQDVVALYNHDPGMVLGRRSSGTLRLRSDDVGLSFELDLPSTSYAQDLRELVQRGDIRGASIGYMPTRDGAALSRQRDGSMLSTVTKVGYLRDISPVGIPAYAGTDLVLRNDFGRVSTRSRLIRARHRVHHAQGGQNR